VGYELSFDPREQRLTLRRLGPEIQTLDSTVCSLPTLRPFPVRVQSVGNRWQVWVNDDATPVLDVTDPAPLNAGDRLAIRPWGSALGVDDLEIEPSGNGRHWRAADASPMPTAERRALEAYCLLVLGLNEVIYPD
jgi:hypothetical protein